MKRILFAALLAAPLLWTACSGNKTEEATEDIVPKGMKAIDLTHLGFPLKFNIPDSTYFPTVDTMETPSGVQVKVGNHFDVLINSASGDEADLNKQKDLINATDAGMSNFIGGDSATLVWETKFGDLSMFHFYHIVKTANGSFFVRDNNSNPDNQFKKKEVDKMLESAKSLRAKPAAAKPEA